MIRAVGFPTTTAALWELRLSTGPLGPMDYTLSAEGARVTLAKRTTGEPIIEIPIDRITGVSAGETISGRIHPRRTLAVMLRIPMPSRVVILPVVPVDEAGQALTWNDTEVWRLARVLARTRRAPALISHEPVAPLVRRG